MSVSSAPTASRRRDELDVLRGLLLVLMAVTHLPTRLNAYSSQPFGYISAAEGFVFLSAFLVGSIYSRQLIERGSQYVRSRLWKRAGRLYLMHLGLLFFLFTVVAALAVVTGRPSLHNHLAVYFASPMRASIAGPLLLYQPPLLDILPMYIVFLIATPAVLRIAARHGWRLLLAASGSLWLFAQLGGRTLVYGKLSSALALSLPLDAFGAFDWFAWQLVWIAGLWLGARQTAVPRSVSVRARRVLMAAAVSATIVFLLWRYQLLGLPLDSSVRFALTDKWHLGGLRIVNFAALAYVVSRGVLPVLAWLRVKALSMLGRASLEVFTAHVPLCVLSRALVVDDATPLPLVQEALVLGATLGAMLFVAWRTGLGRTPPMRAIAAA
ncbi:MAG: OpgC family protein [Steroidobacteraceae bacterium]